MSELDDISQIDHIRAAKKYVLALLSRREYSAFELQRKLQQKHYAADVIERVLADFATEGSLSDRRFAESYTRFRQAKGFGPLRIQQELQQRGVKQAIIDLVLNNCDTQWDEVIRQVRQKKFGHEMPEDFASRAQQSRYLQYRGFSHEQIHGLLSQDRV